jgi:hypothetical protein
MKRPVLWRYIIFLIIQDQNLEAGSPLQLFYAQNHVWKNYLSVWRAVLIRHNYVLVSCRLYWMFTKRNYLRATIQQGIIQTTAGHLQNSHPIIHLCMPYFYGWTTWTASAYIRERSLRIHSPVEILVLSSERRKRNRRKVTLKHRHDSITDLCINKDNKNEVSNWEFLPECFKIETEPYFITFIHIHTVRRNFGGGAWGKATTLKTQA